MMLKIAMWITIGAFVGWNVPQPAWAKYITDKIIAKWNEFRNK